jgi:hypothetical protein
MKYAERKQSLLINSLFKVMNLRQIMVENLRLKSSRLEKLFKQRWNQQVSFARSIGMKFLFTKMKMKTMKSFNM